ncbi:MAG: peptidylprolyl isomerase [Saprospiraceae bacterium]
MTIFFGCKEDNIVVISTEFGDMTIQLFDSTPKHTTNFKKLVKEGYYNDLLFHRVINSFMIQGGDPNSRNADANTHLGNGGPEYTIDAEIGIPHFKGMVAAARLGDSVNPSKASSGSQFYIVHGRKMSDELLNMVEQQKKIKYTQAQREKYLRLGGTPDLDGEYTVFGEVIKGLEVIDKIAAVKTNDNSRPIVDVKMKIN